MTQFNLETTSKLSVRSYDSGRINIALAATSASKENQIEAEAPSIRQMSSSFILTPTNIIENWQYSDVDDFTNESFTPLLEQQPELVLLGTGTNIKFPSQQILHGFHKAGIGIEVMNTASACRTFNVLVAENRFVVAGFLLIQ